MGLLGLLGIFMDFRMFEGDESVNQISSHFFIHRIRIEMMLDENIPTDRCMVYIYISLPSVA